MQPNNVPVPPQLSGLLNLVRWLAALLVVLSHVRALWFADFPNVSDKSIILKIFYFITGYGSEAVIVFFVLSGFLVGGSALNQWRNGTFSTSNYFISRFSRIYTVLFPALICGGLLDVIGLYFFDGSSLYTHTNTKLVSHIIANQLDWGTFLGNLFNLQTILTSHFGSNGPLWSLAYVWWYYCLFGLFLKCFKHRPIEFQFWLYGTVILLAFLSLPTRLLLYMTIWGMGAWVAVLQPSRIKLSPIIGSVLFVLLLIGSRLTHILADGIYLSRLSIVFSFVPHILFGYIPDLMLAAGFSLLLISFRHQESPVIPFLRFHKAMADFSYTIYLMHVPLLVFISAVLSSQYGIAFASQPSSKIFFIATSITLSIYPLLYIFSLFTEKLTPKVKQFLTNVFFQSKLEARTNGI